MIARTEYLDQLIRFRDKQLIKVVTGIRRCGKSTLLELFRDELLKNGVIEEQIIAVNLKIVRDLIWDKSLKLAPTI